MNNRGLSRRDFARLLGAGAGAALLAPALAARGWEERHGLRAEGWSHLVQNVLFFDFGSLYTLCNCCAFS